MRKITRDAATAFFEGRTKTIGNTHAAVSGEVSRLYLHGNLIAEYRRDTGGMFVTLAGWDTVTTRERINGLLTVAHEYGIVTHNCGIVRRRGVPHFVFRGDGSARVYRHAIHDDQWITIPTRYSAKVQAA